MTKPKPAKADRSPRPCKCGCGQIVVRDAKPGRLREYVSDGHKLRVARRRQAEREAAAGDPQQALPGILP